jgi:DNA polymerase-3 subunit alpha
MAAEKEAFGFYFSAHPTDRYRHLAQANNARTFAELCTIPISTAEPERDAQGRRIPAPTVKIAALIEEARWRTSARGRRYLLANLSDSSGQFMASCFDDVASADLEAAAKAGACVLLSAELDRRAGEETPRVTVRSVQQFDGMTTSARLRLDVEAESADAMIALAAMLEGERGGRSELILNAVSEAGSARVRLARDLLLDAELAARIERLPGIRSVRLSSAEPPRLALVS